MTENLKSEPPSSDGATNSIAETNMSSSRLDMTSPTAQQSQSLGGILTDFKSKPDDTAVTAPSSSAHSVSKRSNNSSNNNYNNNGHSNEEEGGASFSMTLAISPADTQHLFAASSEFNREIQSVRTANYNAGGDYSNVQLLLRDAAERCGHVLIKNLVGKKDELERGGGDSTSSTNNGGEYWDMDTGLLFLLDSDKSIKLLVAFDVLDQSKCDVVKQEDTTTDDVTMSDSSSKTTLKDLNEELADRLIKENATTSKLLNWTGAVTLFFSILSAISVCVHGGDGNRQEGTDHEETMESSEADARAPTPTLNNKSPEKKNKNRSTPYANNNGTITGDWKSSHKTHREIKEIATFAADNLMEFARDEAKKENESTTATADTTNHANPDPDIEIMISFDTFGKWYNAGGYSLVPWLELLDLSKWDHHHQQQQQQRHTNNYSASSPSKRFRTNDSNMNEMIGSPTSLFAAGAKVGADTISSDRKMEPSPPHAYSGIQSFSAMFGEMNNSRTVVSFDFSGSSTTDTSGRHQGGFQIDVTEENLLMLQNLVHKTNLANLSPQQVEEVMMRHAHVEKRKHGETVYVISRTQYNKFIRGIVPKEASNQFDPEEIQNFSNYFTNFFTCFDYSWSDLKNDEVNAKELMVGFSFLCAGNKSVKLAAAYETLDVERNGYLSQQELLSYLRSYLTMLAGISLLSPSKKNTHQIRKRLISDKRHDAFLAVENGAKWTLGHFLKVFDQQVLQNQRGSTRGNAVTFEDFAKWYTDGGYKIAPWLELLDLKKFLSLISDSARSNATGAATSTAEVLFTFPLANSQSLVVLRDDAVYVRQVVAELGLLSLMSDDIWAALYQDVSSKAKDSNMAVSSANVEVDQTTFVESMIRILTRTNRQKQAAQLAKTTNTLKNLFSSFDLTQSNRVALNQLMCGLTMLCGGKKSNKLVFAFSLFDSDITNGKKKPSLGHAEFFFFFRSFLIVMFSCCYQSLDLSAEQVSQYISDTAKLVADNVMGYWRAKKVNKVAFEQFSEWYNEGGYEIIPWLELLDLNKWVLADQAAPQQPRPVAAAVAPNHPGRMPDTPGPSLARDVLGTPAAHTPGMIDTPASFAPSPNTDGFKAFLASPRLPDGLFDLDMSALDAEVDETDFMLQNDDVDLDQTAEGTQEDQNALRFHLFSNEQHRGYIISIRPAEVSQLHKLVTETSLCQADASTVCNFILSEAKSNRSKNARTLSKRAFHAAMSKVCQQISRKVIASSTKQELTAFLDKLYLSFDTSKKGSVHALEIACGITVLCGGRKSDKLEHVFELFDEDKDTLLSPKEVARFIQSFLVVLMSISSSISFLDGGSCPNDNDSLVRAIEMGSEWASSQVFDALKPSNGKVCFDDFADWYTKGGYQSIPWLELLDLNKWVLGEAAIS
eukprot:scaffold249373_cov118-Cyclotella_meneghiniana.AAC.4